MRAVETSCALVLIQPGSAFLSVDVVERGDEGRLGADPLRWRKGLALRDDLRQALARLEEAQDRAFAKGAPPREDLSSGAYLDYAEPDLHQLVSEVRELAIPQREHILDVVAHGGDAENRAEAATLLNWVDRPSDTISKIYPLLDDPDATVRNNLTRYMLKFVGRIKDPQTTSRLAHAFIAQLKRPSFGDRNKALFALTAILDAKPELAGDIRDSGCPELEEVASRSVAPNVGGVARMLSDRLRCGGLVR